MVPHVSVWWLHYKYFQSSSLYTVLLNLFFWVGKWEKSIRRNTLRTVTGSIQCSVLYANKISQEYHGEKKMSRITVRLACLSPAIPSPSDIDNKGKHNGIILMSLFSKEQPWQWDGRVPLADVLSLSPFPLPSLLNLSSDRCAIQTPSGCACSSAMALWLYFLIFHIHGCCGRQTLRWLS